MSLCVGKHDRDLRNDVYRACNDLHGALASESERGKLSVFHQNTQRGVAVGNRCLFQSRKQGFGQRFGVFGIKGDRVFFRVSQVLATAGPLLVQFSGNADQSGGVWT